MNRLFLGLALALVASASRAATSAPQADTLMIRHVTVVSADRPGPLPDVDVLIRDGRIARIGPDLPDVATQEINGAGRYLTPGLIDSHVHVSHATGLRGRYTPNYQSLYKEYLAQAPSSYLYFGYTTLIELNAERGGREAFEQTTPHPTLLDCSQGIDLFDGFMALDLPPGGMAEFFPNYLYDQTSGALLPEGADPAAHTPEAVVAAVAGAGGVCVKLYYEEALWWPGERPDYTLPSVDLLRRVDQAANAAGLVTILHATTPDGYRAAMQAGVDILAHGLWEWPGVSYTDPRVPVDVEQLLVDAARTGVSLQPTVQTFSNTASLFDATSLDDPRLAKVLPARYLDYLRTDAQAQRRDFLAMFGEALAAQPGAAPPGDMLRAALERYERQTAELDRNGANLLFGTDTAVGGFGWGNPPGLNGLREMQGWARGGVPLKTIFEAATLRNARAFGLEQQIGTVAPGRNADLLLMDANPLETLDAYDRISVVILGGRPYDRETFSAQARALAEAPKPVQEEPSPLTGLKAAMHRLDFLSGPWTLTRYSLGRDGVWVPRETQDTRVDPSMNGLYLTTRFVTPGFTYEMVFSYDAAMQTYRIVSRDDQSGLMDVYQGDFDADGALVVSNVASGTHYLDRGRKVHNRMTFTAEPGSWGVLIEISMDGGLTWTPQGRGEAHRPLAAP